jgi:DegV family protein with EDD domain
VILAVKVVTDSVSDLPPALAADFGISIVPAKVLFGTEQFSDGVDITTDEFFRRLTSSAKLPTTSQPSVGDFVQVFDSVGENADGIVCVTVSSQVSGTYNSAVQAREQTAAACPIEIVDSMQASMGQGLVALATARSAQSGADLSAVVDAANDALARAHLLGLLDTLEYLQKGGRIGRARALVGTLLKVKPIITVQDGVVHEFGKERTRAKGLAKMREFAEQQAPLEEASVMYTTSDAGLEGLTSALTDALPTGKRPVIARMGPVLGTYVGPNAVGLALLTAQR